MQLISNRQDINKQDKFGILLKESCIHSENKKIKIAVAFFNDADFIMNLLKENCDVDLIIRLNAGTKPEAVKKIFDLNNEHIKIRFYSSTLFHPKLYIIENDSVFIGSSNLTSSGMIKNCEVNIKINYNEELFKEVNELFEYYWSQADVLTLESINIFCEAMKSRKEDSNAFERSVANKLGDTFPGKESMTDTKKEENSLADFRRTYQEFTQAFNYLKNFYESTPNRKWANIPIHIELDRFLSWIWDNHSKMNCSNTKDSKDIIKQKISDLKVQFLSSSLPVYEKDLNNYFELNETFRSKESINALSDSELLEKLRYIFSFKQGPERYHKDDFIKNNSLDKIKNTLNYLLFSSKDDYVKRFYECSKNELYKLDLFGPSSIQELYGNVNKDNIPTCNDRIKNSLHFLKLL